MSKGFQNIATTRHKLRKLKQFARCKDLAATIILADSDLLNDPEKDYLWHWYSKFQYQRLKALKAPRVVLSKMRELSKSRPAPWFLFVL